MENAIKTAVDFEKQVNGEPGQIFQCVGMVVLHYHKYAIVIHERGGFIVSSYVPEQD